MKFDADWPALTKAGVARDSTIVLNVSNEKLSDVLEKVLVQLVGTEPLGYKAEGDTIRISTKAALNAK